MLEGKRGGGRDINLEVINWSDKWMGSLSCRGMGEEIDGWVVLIAAEGNYFFTAGETTRGLK